MSNELFRAQVAELFEKLAWPFNPQQVAQQAAAAGKPHIAENIARGQHTVNFAKDVGRAAATAGRAAGRGANWLLTPFHSEGRALANELGNIGSAVFKSPAGRRLALGAAAGAPIFMSALGNATNQREQELMNLEADPMRGFSKLSIDSFLEKKAAGYSKSWAHEQFGVRPDRMRAAWRAQTAPAISRSVRENLVSSIGEGIGGGIGSGIAGAVMGSIGKGLSALHEMLIIDPKRKQLFESIMRSDPIIADAVERNHDAAKTLVEAYTTMVRFAPGLSLDVNAVRSFLREAVIGGTAGVNYATIKSLIETEKALHSRGDNR